MKKLGKSENEAIAIVFAWLATFGIGCYRHDFALIVLGTIYLATLLACSWRIERLERRIDRYRKTLDRQMHEELSDVESEQEKPEIKMTKVG